MKETETGLGKETLPRDISEHSGCFFRNIARIFHSSWVDAGLRHKCFSHLSSPVNI